MHEQLLARSRDATQRAIAGGRGERIAAFRFVGIGHLTAADAYLAASAAARARAERQAAREALAIRAWDHHTTNREAAWESILPA